MMYAAYVGVAAVATCLYACYKNPWLTLDLQYLFPIIKFAVWAKRCFRAKTFIIDLFEQNAVNIPSKTFLIFHDQTFTYAEMNRRANKVANMAIGLGWKSGDVVAVVIHNEPAFLWTYLGLTKCGIVCSFINTNLRSKSLEHCIQICSPKAIVVGQSHDLQKAVQEVRSDLDFTGSVFVQGQKASGIEEDWVLFDELMNKASDVNPPKSVRASITSRSPKCYIYTSGTTGLPKPAIVAEDRALKGAMIGILAGVQRDDVFYTSLPLYHSAAGLLAIGTNIVQGSTLVLREKFSASQFWEDCRKHNVTAVQYIGELCRFLLSRPKSDSDKDHSVRVAVGNGLRADIWKEFRERFGLQKIVEFYAATEGNMGFINLHNRDGVIGRSSPFLSVISPTNLLKYDYDTAQPIRNGNGFCMNAKKGEPGLFVAKIKRDMEFDGYKGSKDMTNNKILRDVFKKGDAYFNSGDLMYTDDEYFIYFSDRIGDTFRWKGENVATTEVANTLTDLPWIEDANVYGVPVPGADGKCGMAALTLMEGESLAGDHLTEFYRHCEKLLAAYARPRFLRIQAEATMTATLKQQKVNLVKDGFDPAKVKQDALYYMDAKLRTYSKLDMEVFDKIGSGEIRM